MIDDVWNSRRQSTQKEKELQEPGLLLKKIIWPQTLATQFLSYPKWPVWQHCLTASFKNSRAFLMNFCPLRNVKRGDALEFRYIAAGHFVQL